MRVAEAREEDEHTGSNAQSDAFANNERLDITNKFRELFNKSPTKSECWSDEEGFEEENFDAFQNNLDEIILGPRSLSK